LAGAIMPRLGSTTNQGGGIGSRGDKVIVATSPPGTGAVNISVSTPSGSSAIVPASQFAYAAATTANGAGAYVDPGLSGQLVSNLVNVLTNATSPDALEGDVNAVAGAREQYADGLGALHQHHRVGCRNDALGR
jgi:hypothetical protein